MPSIIQKHTGCLVLLICLELSELESFPPVENPTPPSASAALKAHTISRVIDILSRKEEILRLRRTKTSIQGKNQGQKMQKKNQNSISKPKPKIKIKTEFAPRRIFASPGIVLTPGG